MTLTTRETGLLKIAGFTLGIYLTMETEHILIFLLSLGFLVDGIFDLKGGMRT